MRSDLKGLRCALESVGAAAIAVAATAIAAADAADALMLMRLLGHHTQHLHHKQHHYQPHHQPHLCIITLINDIRISNIVNHVFVMRCRLSAATLGTLATFVP